MIFSKCGGHHDDYRASAHRQLYKQREYNSAYTGARCFSKTLPSAVFFASASMGDYPRERRQQKARAAV